MKRLNLYLIVSVIFVLMLIPVCISGVTPTTKITKNVTKVNLSAKNITSVNSSAKNTSANVSGPVYNMNTMNPGKLSGSIIVDVPIVALQPVISTGGSGSENSVITPPVDSTSGVTGPVSSPPGFTSPGGLTPGKIPVASGLASGDDVTVSTDTETQTDQNSCSTDPGNCVCNLETNCAKNPNAAGCSVFIQCNTDKNENACQMLNKCKNDLSSSDCALIDCSISVSISGSPEFISPNLCNSKTTFDQNETCYCSYHPTDKQCVGVVGLVQGCSETTSLKDNPSCYCSYHPTDKQCVGVVGLVQGCSETTSLKDNPSCYCSFHTTDKQCNGDDVLPQTCSAKTSYATDPTCYCKINPKDSNCLFSTSNGCDASTSYTTDPTCYCTNYPKDSQCSMTNTIAGNSGIAGGLLGYPPDLIITKIEGPKTAKSGSKVELLYTVKNQGKGAAGPFQVGFFRVSPTVLFTETDKLGGLAAGASYNGKIKISIPSLLSGTFYLGAYADIKDTVKESDENNNLKTSKTQIIIN